MVASTYINEFGFFFFLRMAVCVSSSSFFSAPEASLVNLLAAVVDDGEA
jgi:hypothetical protein